MKRNGNERGVALIAAVMIVAILAGIGISFAFNMRLEEKAAANYLWSTQADAIARGGIERAKERLVNQRDEQFTFLGSCGNYEVFTFPLVPVSLGDGITAHSRIYILDEAGKINLNTSGHVPDLAATAFSRYHIDSGWTTAEIQPPPIGMSVANIRREKFPGDDRPGIAYPGATGYNPDDDPGWGTGTERFWQNSFEQGGIQRGLSHDGIDNDGDGLVDELNEGIDEPSEFRFVGSDGRLILNPPKLPGTLADRPFITVGETEVRGVDLLDFATLYSRDRSLYQDQWWDATGPGRAKVDLNTATPMMIYNELRDLWPLISDEDALQIALNIEDFRDADDIPTWRSSPDGAVRSGIEHTLFINEVKMDHGIFLVWEWLWGFIPYPDWVDFYRVEEIELHNPWPVDINDKHYRVVWIDNEGEHRTLWDDAINVPAHGFCTPDIIDVERCRISGGEIILLYHPAGGTPVVVERVSLPAGPAKDHYYAKNDPRVPAFPYAGPNPTLGSRNSEVTQGFNPNIGGEVPGALATPSGAPTGTYGWMGHFTNHLNRGFHNPGELGYIHTGGQWETIAMRDIAGRNAVEIARHHQLLDRFTINHPYNRMGRININTASLDILTRLPQMGVQGGVQARRIINRRGTNSFNTIGEAVPFLTPDTDPVELSEEVTQLMQDLVNLVNWVINWPSTWEWWVFEDWGNSLHSEMITTMGDALAALPLNPPIPFYTPPVCSVCGTVYSDNDPAANEFDYTSNCNCSGGSPAYITLEHEITIAIVEGVAEAIVHTTNHVIDWMRTNLSFWWPIEELSEWGINTLLNPILERGNALFRYTITGTDLDGDYFYGEDDELETIVRSISNLITTRSDRFDIVSTGYVMRGGEELAKSQMRAIVCRVTPPVLNAAGEIVASNIEILHFDRRIIKERE